jgi:hypothetical protein
MMMQQILMQDEWVGKVEKVSKVDREIQIDGGWRIGNRLGRSQTHKAEAKGGLGSLMGS